MPSGPDDWLREQFALAYREQAEKYGRFNLAIFGKTGVGKSTLINAIFGEEVAATGIGEPVPREAHLYVHSTEFLGVYDTRGIEVGIDNEKILAELANYVTTMRSRPVAEHLHVAWYCARSGDRRFEQAEAEFARALHQLGLPVIMVITQVPMRDGRPHPDAMALAEDIQSRDLPIFGQRAFMTMALRDDFTGQEAHGLIEVLDATFQVAPQAVEEALTAAQIIDDGRKRKQADAAVGTAATAAASAGAVPIPFADAVILVPIQLGMMAAIAQTYGVRMDRATLAGIAATAGATSVGRSLVGGMFKIIPGAGSLIGGTINASVAGSITFAMGKAWMLVCQRLSHGELVGVDGVLDDVAIRRLFGEELRRQWTRRRKADHG
jgi:uncharacterized protein (DUF697 family)/predicted GTPase